MLNICVELNFSVTFARKVAGKINSMENEYKNSTILASSLGLDINDAWNLFVLRVCKGKLNEINWGRQSVGFSQMKNTLLLRCPSFEYFLTWTVHLHCWLEVIFLNWAWAQVLSLKHQQSMETKRSVSVTLRIADITRHSERVHPIKGWVNKT